MGRFRNPRYAPEFLERKLSPAMMIVGPAADYGLIDDSVGGDDGVAPTDPGDGTPPTDPLDIAPPTSPVVAPTDPGDGTPPTDPLLDPTTASLPA